MENGIFVTTYIEPLCGDDVRGSGGGVPPILTDNPVHHCDKSLDVRGYRPTVFQTAGVGFAKLLYRKLRHIKHSVALTNDGGGVAVPFFDPVFLNDEGT